MAANAVQWAATGADANRELRDIMGPIPWGDAGVPLARHERTMDDLGAPRATLAPPPRSPPASTAALIDLPRERLLRRGTQATSDEELLAILLGTGVRHHPVRAIAAELLRASGGITAMSRASPRELAQVLGVGVARAARIAAAFELGRRAVESARYREVVSRPEDVFDCVGSRLAGLQQEVFLVLGVDVRNQLLEIVEVGRGSVNGVEVHPREIFRPLVRMAAAGGVLVHNHPSGDPTPSPEDRELTRRLRDVGHLIGIPIIDHVVIGDRTWRSIAEWMGVEF